MQVILIKDAVICGCLSATRLLCGSTASHEAGVLPRARWHCQDSSCESTALVHLGLYLHVNSHRERVSAKDLALALHLEATSDNCCVLQP